MKGIGAKGIGADGVLLPLSLPLFLGMCISICVAQTPLTNILGSCVSGVNTTTNHDTHAVFQFYFHDTNDNKELISHFKLALEHLNNKNDGWWDDILPTTTSITIAEKNDGCSSTRAAQYAVDDVFVQGSNAIITASCADSIAGPGAAAQFSLTPVFSAAYPLPAASITSSPSLVQMLPEPSHTAQAIIDVLNYLSLKSIVLFTESVYFVGTLLSQELIRLAPSNSILIRGSFAIETNVDLSSFELVAQSSNARVFVVLTSEGTYEKLLSAMCSKGYCGSSFVWIYTGVSGSQSLGYDKTTGVKNETLFGHLDGSIGIYPTMGEGSALYTKYLQSWKASTLFDFNGDRNDIVYRGTQVYDATILAATVVHKLKVAGINQYDNTQYLNTLFSTTFEGVSGTTKFSNERRNGLTVPRFVIVNFRPSGQEVIGSISGAAIAKRKVRLGLQTRAGTLTLTQNFTFADNSTTVPIDGSCLNDCKTADGVVGGTCFHSSNQCSCYPSYSGADCSSQAPVDLLSGGYLQQNYQIPCGTHLIFKANVAEEILIFLTTSANLFTGKAVVNIFTNDSSAISDVSVSGAVSSISLRLAPRPQEYIVIINATREACPFSFFLSSSLASDSGFTLEWYYILLIVLGGLLLIAGMVLVILRYRAMKQTILKANIGWKIRFDDVIIKLNENELLQEMEQQDRFLLQKREKKQYIYRGVQIYPHFIFLQGERDLVKLLKSDCVSNLLLSHVHINTFIGACLDAPSPFLAYEYSSKGSLRDILRNESLNLDWDFRLSLITDLARGMEYLHKTSSGGVHGKLRDTKCLIDSKWVLKITGYGFSELEESYKVQERKSSISSEPLSTNTSNFNIADRNSKTSLQLSLDEHSIKSSSTLSVRRNSITQKAKDMVKLMRRKSADTADKSPCSETDAQISRDVSGDFREQLVSKTFKENLKMYWVAPESMVPTANGEHYDIRRELNPSCDIYSYGIILYQASSRKFPYSEFSGVNHVNNQVIHRILYKIIHENLRPTFQSSDDVAAQEKQTHSCPEGLFELYEKCIVSDPSSRPTFSQILNYLKSINPHFSLSFTDQMALKLEQYSNNLERLVRKRTRELRKEKQKSEALLLSILPVKIVKCLKQDPTKFIVDRSHNVTVFFNDIVEFTTMCHEANPEKVLSMLNNIFMVMDSVSDQYGITKIKTIGDSYMAACGVPTPNANHVYQVACFGLHSLELMRHLNDLRGKPIQVRAGMHSGEVVAGVVGNRGYCYDLWGDTVNVASRMESNGVPGRLCCSPVVYKALKAKFDFEELDAKHIKGQGLMRRYLIKSEVSNIQRSGSVISSTSRHFQSHVKGLDTFLHPPSANSKKSSRSSLDSSRHTISKGSKHDSSRSQGSEKTERDGSDSILSEMSVDNAVLCLKQFDGNECNLSNHSLPSTGSLNLGRTIPEPLEANESQVSCERASSSIRGDNHPITISRSTEKGLLVEALKKKGTLLDEPEGYCSLDDPENSNFDDSDDNALAECNTKGKKIIAQISTDKSAT
eukprot:Nk52_evm42s217 gene=Nk52_evmTU42s217